jgi:hypothetical protein
VSELPHVVRVLYDITRGISDEIKAAQQDPSRAFEVQDGQLLHERPTKHLYSFRTELVLPIPDETPIRLLVQGSEPVSGTLIGSEDFEVLLELEEDLGEEVPRARVSSEPWFIYEKLRARITDRLEPPDSGGGEGTPPNDDFLLTRLILGESFETSEDHQASTDATAALDELSKPSISPNLSQRASLARCAASPLHFVWGPPGTGKTAALAQTVRMLADRDERCMVLSHSNAAVDVAMLRVADAFEGTKELTTGKVLRLGTPYLPEVAQHEYINPESVLERLYPDLIERRKSLEARRKALAADLKKASAEKRGEIRRELDEVRTAIAEVNTAIRDALENLIREAKVIGATTARLAIDDSVWNWKPDAIHVDEVSMVNFPAIAAGSLIAKKRMILYGDFRQLPPIRLAKTPSAETWLGRDCFEIAGVKQRIDARLQEPRVSLLRTQYRMAPPIANVVNSLAYGDRLENANGLEERLTPLVELMPEPGSAAVMMNTEELRPACFRDSAVGSFSRLNPLHAALALTILDEAITAGFREVALITPYRAQARLLEAGSRPAAEGGLARAATVHRFQGSERDMVVLDLVDSPREKGASILTGKDFDTSLRLLNVALSRARGKLIVIADLGFIAERHPASSPARKVLELFQQNGTIRPADPLSLRSAIDWWPSWEETQDQIIEELYRADESIYVNLPPGFEVTERAVKAFRVAHVPEGRFLVFAPLEIAEALELSRADLRLMNRPGGFFAVFDRRVSFIGGFDPHAPIARLSNPDFGDRLLELSMGASLAVPPPSAEAEALVNDLCGRCPACGEYRRPVQDGRWVLRCGVADHPWEALELEMLTKVLIVLNLRCQDCGGMAVARQAGSHVFIGCTNFAIGCRGRFPRLSEIFS